MIVDDKDIDTLEVFNGCVVEVAKCQPNKITGSENKRNTANQESGLIIAHAHRKSEARLQELLTSLNVLLRYQSKCTKLRPDLDEIEFISSLFELLCFA